MSEKEKIAEEFESIKELVRTVLEKYQEARNNDFFLVYLCLRELLKPRGINLPYVPYSIIKEFSGVTETITRARRWFNERGEFLPTDPEVLEKRRRKEKIYKQYFGEQKI